jgi:hypothetical protein
MTSGILVQVLRAPAPWFLRAFTEGNLFGDGKCRELGKTQVPVPFFPYKPLVEYLENKEMCNTKQQCCGSGSVGSVCFWVSGIRIL